MPQKFIMASEGKGKKAERKKIKKTKQSKTERKKDLYKYKNNNDDSS